MKTIVALLLLGNLGMFIWQSYRMRSAPPPARSPAGEELDRVNRLPLLSELGAGAVRRRDLEQDEVPSAETSSEGTAVAGPGSGIRCFIVGPFKGGDPRPARAQAWLTEKGAEVALLRDERLEETLYWVHFPPAADRKEALARMDELKARGVEDLQVVQRGDMANAISVGVYSKPLFRDRRLVEMRQRGYRPEVVKRYRAVKADWLAVKISDDTFVTADFSDRFPGLELDRGRCRTP